MNLMSGNVTKGLIGSFNSIKLAKVSMNVYEQAKSKGDDATMKRALGYASDNLKDAGKSMKETQEAMKKSAVESKDQEEVKQPSSTEKSNNKSTAVNNSAPVDGTSEEQPQSQSADTQSDKSETYTPEGKVKHAAAKPKLSVSA